ncbi:MAG: hypothetical protein ACRC10_00480 [Thermoguttaceae bacterium]
MPIYYYRRRARKRATADKRATKKKSAQLTSKDYLSNCGVSLRKMEFAKNRLCLLSGLTSSSAELQMELIPFSEQWLSELFKELCTQLMTHLTAQAKSSFATEGAIPIIQCEMNHLYKEFKKQWGYTTETLYQTGNQEYVKNLVVYTLTTHTMEILYKIFPFEAPTQISVDVQQSEEDKIEMAKLIKTTNALRSLIQKLYTQYGVS